MDRTTMAEQLENACLVLDKRGWAQGSLRKGESLCLIGAVSVAIEGNACGDHVAYLKSLIAWVREVNDFRDVIQFNDEVATDVNEVKDALLATAKYLRNLP